MNQLLDTTSPYLKQHADNPVDWHPWGEPALERSRRENKPIFLSIGYSACHWCHVMAHESFEDPVTASQLNKDFIAVKVDREERPDLDHIYQTANQLLTRRSGGWPLSIFLTPDLKPYFSGTYFPKEPRYGMPAFRQILAGAAQAFHNRRADVEAQSAEVTRALAEMQKLPSNGRSVTDLAMDLGEKLLDNFDPVYGGFGGAPKFPQASDMRLLLRLGFRTGDPRFTNPVAHTLDQMVAGGIMDQIGGGFARYSVDEMWLVPHFEKMLYDNGMMLLVLAEADALLGVDPERRRARQGIVSWLARRMTLPEGGFAASMDADSEGEEGRYYLWTLETLNQILAPEQAALAAAAWGVVPGGNFEGGATIATRAMSSEALRTKFGPDAEKKRDAIARQLLQARRLRVPPGRDDKLLTGWNALAIKGLLRHAAVDGDASAFAMADKALRFLCENLRDDQGWFGVWRSGRRHTRAFLDDHAFILDALMEAAAWIPQGPWLAWAEITAEEMLDRFSDPKGGFFFTPAGQADVIIRAKNHHDSSTPSGNSVAISALFRLAQVTGKPLFRQAAEETFEALSGALANSGGGHGQLALGADLLRSGGAELLFAGPGQAAFAANAGRFYLPDPVLIRTENVQNLPQHLQGRLKSTGASLCSGGVCRPPVEELEAWQQLLKDQTPLSSSRKTAS